MLMAAWNSDPWTGPLTDAAGRAGTVLTTVSDLTELQVEVRVDSSGTAACTVRGPGGTVPHGIVFRGGAVLGEQGFAGSEHLAAWWALLAAFDGPVVNRPTRHGPLLTMDRLRTRRAPGVAPGAWALRSPWSSKSKEPPAPALPATTAHPAPSPVPTTPQSLPAPAQAPSLTSTPRTSPRSVVAVVRDAGDRRPRPGPDPQGLVTCDTAAVEIMASHAGIIGRVLLAGDRFLVPAAQDTAELPTETAERLRQILAPDLPALVGLLVEFTTDGRVRILDVDPFPGTDLLGPALPDAADAVVRCATGGVRS